MVNNADDMDKLMTMGNRNRSIGATNMNALSSRSHAIFSITVECSEKSLGNYSFLNDYIQTQLKFLQYWITKRYNNFILFI